jgi:hypothetical protein
MYVVLRHLGLKAAYIVYGYRARNASVLQWNIYIGLYPHTVFADPCSDGFRPSLT